MIESFFLAESESEYYSSIRKFLNPNPNIIRDFKKDLNIFESLKRFKYSENYSNNSVIFEQNMENKKQKAGIEKAYSKSS